VKGAAYECIELSLWHLRYECGSTSQLEYCNVILVFYFEVVMEMIVVQRKCLLHKSEYYLLLDQKPRAKSPIRK
jgi:hypothetical protein